MKKDIHATYLKIKYFFANLGQSLNPYFGKFALRISRKCAKIYRSLRSLQSLQSLQPKRSLQS